MINILVISRKLGTFHSPVISVRILEILQFLKKNKQIQYSIVDEFSSYAKPMLAWAHVVIFNKHSSDAAYDIALLAKEKGLKVIYDVDDLILEWPKNHHFLYKQKKESFTRFIQLSDITTVENERIKNEISAFKNNCIIIENSIDTERRKKKNAITAKTSTYCFSAYTDKIEAFNTEFIETLKDFHARKPQTNLAFYGDNLMHIMSLPFIHHRPVTDYETFLDSLIQNDMLFGLVPLGGHEDSEQQKFNMCKSPIKYIMYAYAHIPGIYSNVPPYSLYIENDVTGILVNNNKEEWLDAMLRLESDDTLRKKIVKNSYEDIKANFCTSTQANIYHKYVLQ